MLNTSAQKTKEIFALQKANQKIDIQRYYALRRFLDKQTPWSMVLTATQNDFIWSPSGTEEQ